MLFCYSYWHSLKQSISVGRVNTVCCKTKEPAAELKKHLIYDLWKLIILINFLVWEVNLFQAVLVIWLTCPNMIQSKTKRNDNFIINTLINRNAIGRTWLILFIYFFFGLSILWVNVVCMLMSFLPVFTCESI